MTRHRSYALALGFIILGAAANPLPAAMPTCSPLAACPIKPVPITNETHQGKLMKELPQLQQQLQQLNKHQGLTDQLKQTYGAPGPQANSQAPTAINDANGYKPILPPGVDPSAAQSLTAASEALDSALWSPLNSNNDAQKKSALTRDRALSDTIVQAYSLALNRRQAIADAGTAAVDLAQGLTKSTNLRGDIAANARARTMVAQSADTFAELMHAYLQLEAMARLADLPVTAPGTAAALSASSGSTDQNFDAARVAALQDIAAGRLTNSVFNAVTSHNVRSAVMQNINAHADAEATIIQPWENAVKAIAADDAAMIKRLGDLYKDPEAAWQKLRTSLFDQIKAWKMPFSTIEQLSDQGAFAQAANAGLGAPTAAYNETIQLADLAIKSVNARPEAWGTLTSAAKERLSQPARPAPASSTGTTGGDNIGSATTMNETVVDKPTALNPSTDLAPIATWIADIKEERFRQYFVTDDPNPRPVTDVKQIVAEIRADKGLVDPGRSIIDQDLAVLQQNIQSAQQVIGSDSKYAPQLASAQQKYQAMLADVTNNTFVDP